MSVSTDPSYIDEWVQNLLICDKAPLIVSVQLSLLFVCGA